MGQNYRYGDYQREATIERNEISYNNLTPKLERDEQGHYKPYSPPPVKLRSVDVFKLLKPYISVRFMDQLKAVVPLAIYLALFQFFVLRQLVQDSFSITAGLFAVCLGLMFFMEGLKLGLMPFGEVIGNTLPKKSPLPVVLLIAFLLGIGVTFAEPAIGALKQAGQIVSVERAPYLYTLLNDWSGVLVLVVGGGVGLAAILGTLRFLYGWSLKPMVYLSLAPALALTMYASGNPELTKILGLAWDCGAVTTGPVTVPLVLSLGIGIAAAAGKGDSGLSGFGIVTLASIFPIIGVLILSLVVANTVTPEEIIAAAKIASAAAPVGPAPWYESSPGVEVILGIRAILPLVLFLYLVLRYLLKEQVKNAGEITYGITLTIVGMCVFNLGLTYGLSALGEQSGSLVPASFIEIKIAAAGMYTAYGPIYSAIVGMILSLGFAWVLGFGATLAEPALNALGATVENLTNGVFKKQTLMIAVSIGVAFGLAIGLAKLIFELPLQWLLIPSYALGIILTYFSTEEFVNVAWDSAGVTTGPITVPLVLAMGLGFGNAVDALEGFGILSMASICPILSVLITGLWVRYRAKTQAKAATHAGSASPDKEVQTI
ncbi:protein of unknown function DUF1538 [Magnetococcus marinus MC-1]|uniref:DUF1538 domain-containing protein n=1 Tax=Magnetococcus marinus (strain ATCC BAA-1437 / JCM 17883 / MC-1) TaxID=156889 RepID=A0L3T7_MAGMM|nr:DUF1538 domain-containing protein [Magnetococcus marinus]ABK42630.1 protein of unknown function DUF1538 [Magnetococcus marinus MC-1]